MCTLRNKGKVSKVNEVDILLQRLIIRLKAIKIPVSENIKDSVKINSRAKSRLGCCIYKNGYNEIEISEQLLTKDKEALLEETLVHELLHTCYGCRNHGARWKSYAKRVSDIFGYDIKRTVQMSGDTQLQRREDAKYILICKSCGAEIPRMRLSNAVKQPGRYRCKCGGRLELKVNK